MCSERLWQLHGIFVCPATTRCEVDGDVYFILLSCYVLSLQLFNWLFLLLLFICFWLSVFEYQIRTKCSRSWNCLWWWIGKRILIPLPIQRMSWFMLWWVEEDLFTLILKLSIYFNDWCTVILNDKWNFFQFSFSQYLGPCPFVRVCARCFRA